MAEHCDTVTDTEKCLADSFVCINENSFKKLPAAFGQILSTVIKSCGYFPFPTAIQNVSNDVSCSQWEGI